MSKENVQVLLKQFGNTIGLADLALDEEGFCSLTFDDQIVLNLQYDQRTENIVIFAELGKIKDEGALKVYARLLEANIFWKETGGGTLCVEPKTMTAILEYQEAVAHMNDVRFQRLIEGFINTAEYWISHLDELQTDVALQPDAVLPTMGIRG